MAHEWIVEGLEKAGKTRKGLAHALGRAPSMVTDLLSGKRELKASEIRTIAAYLEVSPPSEFTVALQETPPQIGLLHIVGEVAAGVWHEANADAYEREPYDAPVDPRFPADAQYLLRVRGTSINRQAVNGGLVKCLRLYAAPREPRDGDWVIVQRAKNGFTECTVKQLRTENGERMLFPDSTDPAHQEPIRVGRHDGDEVEIVAFVLDFINPATRL